MCGRFTQSYTWTEVQEFLRLGGPARNLQPRYNIAPTDTVDIAFDRDGERVLAPVRWGLVPAWWNKPLKQVPASFNARRESVAEKPLFRGAWKAGRRCVVPMSGFYEWTVQADGKQPFYICGRDMPVLFVAGLHDTWRPRNGDAVASCTMIVEPANLFMYAIHDRMPTFIRPEHIDGWLSGCLDLDALGPTDAEALQSWAVSRRVNKTGAADDPGLIERVSTAAAQGALFDGP